MGNSTQTPFRYIVTLRSCYLSAEIWPASYSTEETEKKQASLEANHFATRPRKHNCVKG